AGARAPGRGPARDPPEGAGDRAGAAAPPAHAIGPTRAGVDPRLLRRAPRRRGPPPRGRPGPGGRLAEPDGSVVRDLGGELGPHRSRSRATPRARRVVGRHPAVITRPPGCGRGGGLPPWGPREGWAGR